MVGKFLFFLSAATATFLGLSASAVATSQNVDIIVTHDAHASSAPGPLTVLGSNPHYFKTPDNKGIYLTGEDTWTGAWSFAGLGNFSFTAYVDYLTSLNQNFLRYWSIWDETLDGPFGGHGAISPLPFNRSGTCCAGDGGNKFNLTSFNQSYFDSLKANVEYAGSHGMYVMVLLFFDTDYSGGSSWATDYWNGVNNVNSTTTDLTQIEVGTHAPTLALQQAYVRKFVDTLATEPNVLWEISNEGTIAGNASPSGLHTWQEGLISLIHSYEISQGYTHHPVGAEYDDSFIASSAADFVMSYGAFAGDIAKVYSLGKPVVADTDHYGGGGETTDWWWQGFMNGNNLVGMDDMHGTGLSGNLDFGFQQGIVNNRLGVQQTRTLTSLVDMTAMVPRGDLASSGYALADTAGHKFMVYAGSAGSVKVNLSSAGGVALRARWLSTATGSFSSTTNLTGGSSSQAFTSPFGGTPAALLITP